MSIKFGINRTNSGDIQTKARKTFKTLIKITHGSGNQNKQVMFMKTKIKYSACLCRKHACVIYTNENELGRQFNQQTVQRPGK